MPDHLPIPDIDPPKVAVMEDTHDEDTEEDESKSHLRNVRDELEEFIVCTLNANHRLMNGLPHNVLHTDCGKELLTNLTAVFIVAEKRKQDPIKALKRGLLAIAKDRGHIISNLFQHYADRAHGIMNGSSLWKDGCSNADVANIVVRTKDGKVEFKTVNRGTVQQLCTLLANQIEDYAFDKRLQMREAVQDSQQTFGKTLTTMALEQSFSE